jgi:NADPH:quinone reductase-like Zn-dependent oxidoreductase
MKAAIYRRFGGPENVRIEQVPRPSVNADDVLIRVHASTVSAADHRARRRDVRPGLRLLAAVGIGASGHDAACWAWTSPASSRPSARMSRGSHPATK